MWQFLGLMLLVYIGIKWEERSNDNERKREKHYARLERIGKKLGVEEEERDSTINLEEQGKKVKERKLKLLKEQDS